MRKAVFMIAILTLLLLVFVYYPSYVQKPELNGSGPLSVQIDPRYPVPATHNPLDWWQTHHMDVVNRGDLQRADCLYCHEAQTSCENCHAYVGIDAQITPVP